MHVLNNAALVDPQGRWRVLRTTLWTDFTLFGADPDTLAESIDASRRVMLDFRGLIQMNWPHDTQDSPRDFAPDDSLALHRQARAWLESELARPFGGKTIVVTHHAPHRLSLAERYAEDRVRPVSSIICRNWCARPLRCGFTGIRIRRSITP